MRKFTMETGTKSEKDHFLLFEDVTEFIARCDLLDEKTIQQKPNDPWAGGHGMEKARLYLKEGQAKLVPESDKFLATVEAILPPPTARHAVIDDVCGQVPNVPAYLAGNPLSMRRKVKRENEAAPVAVILNLGSSASVSVNTVRQRGLAAVALVRAISSLRPVELWAGVSCQSAKGNDTCNAYFRLDTSPLDLIRAVHLLADPSISRVFLYEILRVDLNAHSSIPWGRAQYQSTFEQVLKRGFPYLSDIVAMPVLHADDASVKDPATWIVNKVQFLSDTHTSEAA